MVGRPARHAWLALEQGALADAGTFADASLLAAGPEFSGARHALAEVSAVKARLAAEYLEVDEADVWAERAVDFAAELGAPVHQCIAREATIEAIEARVGAAEALRRLEQLTATAPLTPALRTRHSLLVAELAGRGADASDEAEQRISGLPAGPRRSLILSRIAADRGP